MFGNPGPFSNPGTVNEHQAWGEVIFALMAAMGAKGAATSRDWATDTPSSVLGPIQASTWLCRLKAAATLLEQAGYQMAPITLAEAQGLLAQPILGSATLLFGKITRSRPFVNHA